MKHQPSFQNKTGNILALLIFSLGACVALFALFLDFLLPSGRKPNVPEFKFENVGACLETSQNIVEQFVVGNHQYVCADMETNVSPVYLELRVFTSDKKKQVYVRGGTFASGSISFIIDPPLPPGRYWAKIVWARPALTDFEFEVITRNDD